MFWRASAHKWKGNAGIRLGPYEESLRIYLMGESPFPQSCVLWVSVPETSTPLTGLSLSPYGGRYKDCHAYKLVVLGVGFNLFIGQRIPPECRSACFVHAEGNPIFGTDMLEESILNDIRHKHASRPELLSSLAARRNS